MQRHLRAIKFGAIISSYDPINDSQVLNLFGARAQCCGTIAIYLAGKGDHDPDADRPRCWKLDTRVTKNNHVMTPIFVYNLHNLPDARMQIVADNNL